MWFIVRLPLHMKLYRIVMAHSICVHLHCLYA